MDSKVGSNATRDLLTLCHVPRWAVTRMLVPQNVAEHSFRTAVIAARIAAVLGQGVKEVVLWALVHDAAEAYASDVPGPFKDAVGRDNAHAAEETLCPWYAAMKLEQSRRVLAIVKVADVLEGFTWWQMHGCRNTPHSWIRHNGPCQHNVNALVNIAREKAEDIGVTPDVMETAVLAISYEILGRSAYGK